MINIKNELDNKGFCLFSIDKEESILEISKSIGKVIEIENNLTVQTLTPKKEDNKGKNTYSGNYGLSAFPAHSDMAHWYKPPKYLLLKCVQPAQESYTSILNFENILKKIDADFELAHFIPRRRLNFKTNILKILNKDGICRWDNLFIKPINQKAEFLREEILCQLSNIEDEKIYLKNSGDCIIIDNWKMLHGRSAINEYSTNRIYQRTYLSEIHNA